MVSLMELLQLSFKPSEVPGEFGFVRFLSRGSIEMGSQGRIRISELTRRSRALYLTIPTSRRLTNCLDFALK